MTQAKAAIISAVNDTSIVHPILVVDDSPICRDPLAAVLEHNGYPTICAGNGREALEVLRRTSVSLLLLDVTMPEMDGLALLARLRGDPRWAKLPVILLTEPDADPIARIRALESGADDVVPRDVYLELRARVRALLRRTALGQAEVVEAGPIVVDHRSRQVRVGETAVRLSGREFELAGKLASDPLRVFTKSELLRDVWGIRGTSIRTRTVDSHASRLRRKLEAAGAAGVVVNDWGVGYRLLP